MHRSALTFAVLLSLTAARTAPLRADDAPQGALFLGPGRMLEAARPRQLSLDAHVTQFLYQPGGLSIAYVSAQTDVEVPPQTVRLVGLKRGGTVTVFAHAGVVGDDYFRYSLTGWSADARYLIVETIQFIHLPDSSETGFRPVFTCVDVGKTPFQIRPITLSLPPPSKETPVSSARPWWSPSRTRLVFDQSGLPSSVSLREEVHVCAVYDPAQDHSDAFSLPAGESVRGWLDEGHLLLFSQMDNETRYYTWSLTAATQTEIPRPAVMPERNAGDSQDVSPKAPNLTLDVEQRFHPDREGVTGISSHLLWVRRAGQPKALSAMPVGLTPGEDEPAAVWSPNGKQIAFLDHGDLFVTDLSERAPRPKEKYLAGETLTCPEERNVAAEALKQIGLAILQYTQDNDEQFPAPAGVTGAIRPYLPPGSLLAVGGHPFMYHAPPDLALARMDSPASTVLGTINLPCGRVTLFADGHVRDQPSTEAPRP